MAKHILLGQRGENIAEDTLLANGYRIIARNWRFKRLEIDFVAEDNGVLVFVEVKTRNDITYGMPYEAVHWKKEQQLAKAASRYIGQTGHQGEIRFDIISIVLPQDLPPGLRIQPEVRLIKDAFWPR